MATQILLLRGINVGGHGKLPMAELKNVLADLGASNIQTYIQSGNAVFEGDLAATGISIAIEVAKGFRPHVLLLSSAEFKKIAVENPVPDAVGNQLHIWFTGAPFNFDHTTAETLRKPSERIEIGDRVIYLHAPHGIGRSKLAEKIEKLADVTCTARNLNTVNKLLGMIG